MPIQPDKISRRMQIRQGSLARNLRADPSGDQETREPDELFENIDVDLMPDDGADHTKDD